jgi:ring-1,2-phenylacetyl-CoA epoxidase subunit PaaE
MLKFHRLTVKANDREAEDAIRLRLSIPEALSADYQFEPGQHVAVRLEIDGTEERRTYSIVDAEPGSELTLALRVHPSGRVSRYLAQHVRAGDEIEVLTPNGSFQSRIDLDRPRTFAAFAAGCGITPIHSIVAALLAGSDQCRCLLFCGNQSRERAMLLEDLLALKDRYLERLSLFFVMSREPQDVALFNGRLDREKLTELAGSVFDVGSVDEYFLCGPDTMIDDLTAALVERDVPPDHIHAEHFTSDFPAAERAEHATAAESAVAGDQARVTVVMDGRRRTFDMPMGGVTVLDAAGDAGIDLPYSCRAGVCSTCRTKLVRGQVEMAEQYALEEWEVEAGYVLACQSHPLTPELELNYDET